MTSLSTTTGCPNPGPEHRGPSTPTEGSGASEQSVRNEAAPEASRPTIQTDIFAPLKYMGSVAHQVTVAAGTAASATAGAVVDATAAVVQQGAHVAASAATVTLQTGQKAFEMTHEAATMVTETATQATSDSLNALSEAIQQSSTVAGDFIGQQFAKVLTNAGSIVTSAGGTLSSTVNALAGDPNTPPSIRVQGLRIATGLLPVVGNAKAIGDARQKYRQALALPEGDEQNQRMHEARRDCLIATSLLSVELATIGASGALDKVLKGGNLVASVLNAGKTVREVSQSQRWLPKVNVDILSPQVDLALAFPPLREAMDIILRFNPESAAPR